ncbi:MTERF5 [Symbiodinium pilosum]|uniref:mTERF5 protein n=1 Tax=Symbiodinium pilosum TaxID=2952 RepID=A0A812MZU8_SYMPI|nr:MTERF5 [Symbiodinium pilosum]
MHSLKPWTVARCAFPPLFWRNGSTIPRAPKWWRAGHARQRPGSIAEAELLSHLALLLQPDVPIKEVFRNFPVEKSEKWGKNQVSPDMAVYGALRLKEAALFLEYDGYYRHHTPAGMLADVRKSEVLLKHAPAGSCVLRIAHAQRDLEWACETREVTIDSWQVGHHESVLMPVIQVIRQLLNHLSAVLRPEMRSSLQRFLARPEVEVAKVIARCPNVLGRSMEMNSKAKVQWLRDTGLTKMAVAKVIARHPAVLGCRIEENLKPTVQWLRDTGLTKMAVAKVIARSPAVAKVIARCPAVLGCSIEENLKPTVQWLLDKGLVKMEIAKVIARHPAVLACSIEKNLKPTVQWLRDTGLTKVEVAKVVARSPAVLGYSIEKNLKPTVQWLRDTGLTKVEVARVIARCPAVFGYSIEENLKPTVQWLRDTGLTKMAVAKVIARYPNILGFSIEENLKPTVQWLRDTGLTKVEVAKVIARCPNVVGQSIHMNLKGKVQWFLELGLDCREAAGMLAVMPSLFGLNITRNLSPKMALLQQFVPSGQVPDLLRRYPAVLTYSYERWSHRFRILNERSELSKFASAMQYTEAAFTKRFGDNMRTK